MQSGIKLISRIYLKLVLLQVAVGTLLRIVLLFNEQTSDISFTFGQWQIGRASCRERVCCAV